MSVDGKSLLETRAFGERRRALFAAGLSAWILLTLADLLPVAGYAFRNVPDYGTVFDFLPALALWVAFYLIIGLPAALAVAFSLGRIAFNWGVRHGATHWFSATLMGLLVGLIAGLISLSFTFVLNLSPSNGFAREAGVVVYHNGLTAEGWAIQFSEFFTTVLAGGVSGLVAWWVAGMGDGGRDRQVQ